MADEKIRVIVSAEDEATKKLNEIKQGIEDLKRQAEGSAGPLNNAADATRNVGDAANDAFDNLDKLRGILSVIVGLGTAKEVGELAEAYTRLTNQVKVATETDEEYQTSLKNIIEIAKNTHSDLETTASLYSKVNLASKEMGISQQQVADLTTLISKGMQLGGATAAEYGSATLQLTQAFNAGVLRGEEFNSVMEASPELMRSLAAGLGIAVGELRGLAEAGKLTSTIVSQALLSQADTINTKYAEMTKTVAQAFSDLQSAAVIFVGEAGESTGAAVALADALTALSENMSVIAAVAGTTLAVSMAKATQSTISYVQSIILARQADAERQIVLAQQQAQLLATAQAQVAAAQGAYNLALANQRQAYATLELLAANQNYGVTEAEVAVARRAAAAAAITATTATERYAQAQSALAAVQGASAASTTLLSRVMSALMGPAGLILTAITTFGLLLSMFSKQKTETDALTQSTEQYTDSLKKLNEQQLKGKILDINDALTKQEDVLKRARYEARELDETYTETGETITKSRVGTDEYTQAQATLATETQKYNELLNRRKIAQDALNEAEEKGKISDTVKMGELLKLDTALEKVVLSLEKRRDEEESVAESSQKRLEAEQQLAIATGNATEADRLSLEMLKQRIVAAQEKSNLDLIEKTVAEAKLKVLNDEAALYDKVPKALADNIEKTKKLVEEKTRALNTSTAQLNQLNAEKEGWSQSAESIRYVNEQYQKLGVESPKQLQLLADAQKKAFDLMKKDGVASAETLDTAFVKLAETQIKAANAAGKPIPEFIRQEAAARGLSTAVERLIITQQRLSPEFEALREKSEDITDVLESNIMLFDRETETKRRSIQSSMELARAKGDEYTAQAKSIELAKYDIERAKARVELNQQLITSLDIQVNAMFAAANADGLYTEAEKKVVSSLIDTINALKQKNELAAQQIPISEKNLQQQQANVAAARQELQLTEEEIEAKKKLAAANEEAAASQAKEKENAGQLAAQGAFVTDIIGGWEKSLGSLSEAALKTFQDYGTSQQKVTAGMSEMEIEIKKLDEAEQIALRGHGDYGFVKWANDVALRAIEVKKAFYEQAQSADRFSSRLQAMTEGGKGNLQALVHSAENARDAMNLLDQTRLDQLNSAIESATRKLEAMRESAESALDSAQRALLQEKGDQGKLLELDYEQKKLELQKQIDAAREAGDQQALANLLKAKKLEEDVYNIKKKKLAEEKKQNNNTSSNTGSTSSVDALKGINKTTVLNFLGPDGKNVSGMFDDDDVSRMIDLLKKSGMRLSS